MTLAHAQTLDGAVSLRRGVPTAISGARALEVTHRLRSLHELLAVGVDTIISDDPLLDARLVGGAGPRPLVLDSRLRTPPTARVVGRGPLIACVPEASRERRAELERRGAEVLTVGADARGRVDVARLCEALAARGVCTVMLEGGPRVITSFLAARLVDYAAITVSPRLMGGTPLLEHAVVDDVGAAPALTALEVTVVGDDLLLAGDLAWPR